MELSTRDWEIIGSLVLCIVSTSIFLRGPTTVHSDHIKLLGHRITTWVYNLCFHPLADFPGPFLGRASLVSPIAGEIQFRRCKMACQ